MAIIKSVFVVRGHRTH